jgi:hypothetical protein
MITQIPGECPWPQAGKHPPVWSGRPEPPIIPAALEGGLDALVERVGPSQMVTRAQQESSTGTSDQRTSYLEEGLLFWPILL